MNRIATLGPAMVVALTMVGMLFAGPTIVRSIGVARTKLSMEEAAVRLQDENILARIAAAQQDIAVVVEPSVVHVSGLGSVDRRRRFAFASTGSGWIWDEDGHVVTNAHVVDGADEIEIQLHTGEVRVGRVIGLIFEATSRWSRCPRRSPATRRQSRRRGRSGLRVRLAVRLPLLDVGRDRVGLGRSADLEQIDYENFIRSTPRSTPATPEGR